MNTLKLELYGVSGWIEPAVRIVIDGVDLVERAHAAELFFATAEGHPETAGWYAGLPRSEVAPPAERLFGRDPFYDLDKVALLVCAGCGEEGCWPLLARIEVAEDQVAWRDFEQPQRPGWNLSALGPFVFERKQYQDAIAALGNIGSNR